MSEDTKEKGTERTLFAVLALIAIVLLFALGTAPS